MAKGPQQGDRYGDWYLESRAKPVEGKRFWNAVNTVTDEKAVVPQTHLKALGEGKFFPSDESFIDALEADVPSSAEITAKVLLANYADDPFSIPDGILPDFEVEFIEPCPLPDGCDPDIDHDHDIFSMGLIDDRETYEDDYEPGAEDDDDLDGLARWAAKQDLGLDGDDCVADARCKVVGTKHIIDTVLVANQDVSSENGVYQRVDHLDKRDPLAVQVASQFGQWEPRASNKELLRVAELCEQLSDAICDLVEARL